MTWGEKTEAWEREILEAIAVGDARRLAEVWREQLTCFWKVSADRQDPEPNEADGDYQQLYEAAHRAIVALGGQGEPSKHTMADYDHVQFGPMLGVSDEGSATAAIRRGALAAPKVEVFASKDPFVVGVAHDAERLGAVGEVVVGPDEFATIRLACHDRLLTTTNVGTRVNIRNFAPPPVVTIRNGPLATIVDQAKEQLQQEFAPYLKTASGRARSCTVFARFAGGISPRVQRSVLKQLKKSVQIGKSYQAKMHRLGLLGRVSRNNGSRLTQAQHWIDLAASAGLTDLALDGDVLASVAANISETGLLNILEPFDLQELLGYAQRKGVSVAPLQRVDPQTTARHVWTGLAITRSMGFELGKYGLVPLTHEQQSQVIARIQYWLKGWCAAPVFYVDYPLVMKDRVFHGKTLSQGIREWLTMVATHGVRVVLIDTAKKSEKRRLLKDDPDDPVGFLELDDIANLSAFGAGKEIKVLWAGGITLPQAFAFGRLGVFGVYVTSAAAATQPVSKRERRDPGLLSAREPDAAAVTRVKLLLEAGFHVGRKKEPGSGIRADTITAAVHALLEAVSAKDIKAATERQKELYRLVASAWRESGRRSE